MLVVYISKSRASVKCVFNMSLFVGCLTSQQHASVSQGRLCSDNFTCCQCHTKIEAADQTFHLIQSQYTDTGLTSPSTDSNPGSSTPEVDALTMRPASWILQPAVLPCKLMLRSLWNNNECLFQVSDLFKNYTPQNAKRASTNLAVHWAPKNRTSEESGLNYWPVTWISPLAELLLPDSSCSEIFSLKII